MVVDSRMETEAFQRWHDPVEHQFWVKPTASVAKMPRCAPFSAAVMEQISGW